MLYNNMRFILAFLFSVSQCWSQQPPTVVIPTNKITRVLVPVVNVHTNMQISWNPYTNVRFAVSNSPDLTNWTWYTNVPVWQTSLIVPMNHPEMFYKVTTIYE